MMPGVGGSSPLIRPIFFLVVLFSMSNILEIISDVNLNNLIISVAIIAIAGIVQGYSGFGGGTISVPVLAILYSPIIAVGLITPIYILGAASLLPNAIKKADYKEVIPLCLAGSIAVFIGLSFLVNADPVSIKRIMGLFILLSTALMMFGRSYNGPRNIFLSFLAGAATGGITGGSGIPGAPVMVMYYMSAKVGPKIQRANIIITGSLFSVCVVMGLANNSIYSPSIILLICILGPVFMVCTRLGQYLFKIAPTEWFKRIAYCLLITSGAALLII